MPREFQPGTGARLLRLVTELAGGQKCEQCATPVAQIRDGGCFALRCPYRPKKARARPAQHESTEMQILDTKAARHWWYPGYLPLEHRTPHKRQAWENAKHGVKPGLPDLFVLLPHFTRDGMSFPARSIAIEVKRPDLAPAGKAPRGWWLDQFPNGQGQRWGLRESQARILRILDSAGWLTYVAYGADHALAYIVNVAGARPDSLPDSWPV